MDTITELNKFVAGWSNDESLKALLEKKIENQRKESKNRKNYYFLTELTNPMQTYWARINPVEKPKKLARKLVLGKQLQYKLSYVFSSLPNFILEEGKIDGFHVGIPGVRGSVDYMIENKIIELKTKEVLPKDVNNIFELYPNDLEQLVFYSVLHPSQPKENYLIFVQDFKPHKVIAFKVLTKNFGEIKKIIQDRIALLDEALEKKDPSKLGKCRYYNKTPNCQFEDQKICACANAPSLSLDKLKSSIDIIYDEGYSKLLEEKIKNNKFNDSLYSVKDIIAPRKHYMENILLIEPNWEGDKESDEYYACLSYMIRELKYNLNHNEIEGIKSSLKDPRLRVGYKWMKLKDSTNLEGENIPYTIKVSNVDDIKWTHKPSQYHLTELGIICASHNKQRGIIFVVYPKLNDLLRVYQITYNDSKNHMRKIVELINNLEKAELDKNLLSLSPCPNYMNDAGKCSILKECHSNKGSGCIPNKIIN